MFYLFLQAKDDQKVDDDDIGYGSQFYSDDMIYKPSYFIGSVRELLNKIPSELQVTHVRL